MLGSVRPGQVVLLGSTTASFPTALHSLAPYQPTVTRTGTLRSGPLALHVWVVRLGAFYHPPAQAG